MEVLHSKITLALYPDLNNFMTQESDSVQELGDQSDLITMMWL